MEKKRFAFDYNLDNLSTWANENASEILIKDILGTVLPRYSTIRPGIRGTEKIAYFESSPILTSDSCGFNPTGDTSINQITIQTCAKKSDSKYCPRDLYSYFLSQRLSSNNNFQEEMPFEEVLIQDYSNRLAQEVEKRLWQNTIATGGTYGGECFDGVLSLVTSGNGATQITYTAATASNGLEVFTTIYENLPSNVLHRNDLICYTDYSSYRALVGSMRNSSYINLFSFDDANAAQGSEWAVMIPGTNVRVVPTIGLEGQSTIIMGPASYINVAFNMTDNDGIDLKAMYNPYEDQVQVMARLVFGVGVFDPASFVICK